MPIMHRGFSAWIVVEGKVVEEYMASVNQAANIVQCWIPGNPGQTFVVHWKDHDTGIDTAGYIDLDGHTVPGRFLFGKGQTQRSGVRASATEERPFQFQGPPADSRRTYHAQGLIELKVKRIRRDGSVDANKIDNKVPKGFPLPGSEVIAGFGPKTKAHDQYSYTWGVKPHPDDELSPNDKPATYVTFVFRYRTKRKSDPAPSVNNILTSVTEFLRSQGIMPPAPVDIALPAPTTRASSSRRAPSGQSSSGRRAPSGQSSRPPAASPYQTPSASSPSFTFNQDSGQSSHAPSGPPFNPFENPPSSSSVFRVESTSSSTRQPKSFGALTAGRGPQEPHHPVDLPKQQNYRTKSGRVLSAQSGSYPGEGILLFDQEGLSPSYGFGEDGEDYPVEDNGQPQTQYNDQNFTWQ